ncbi:MAG: hypothetical protein NC414_09505 [Bacteroidales bacterium]|nr:hypothetical protein [Bacteroidales bacterium]
MALWLDRTQIRGTPPQYLARWLDNAVGQRDERTGDVKVFGGLGGLSVACFSGGVSIRGSFPRYFSGGNIYTLDRSDTEEAVNMLSEALHADVSAAFVSGLEFGTTFTVKHPVPEYLKRLGDMPRYVRTPFTPYTLYYMNRNREQRRELYFYDKRKEEEERGTVLPDSLRGANLLRCELRMSRRLRKQLRVSEVTARTLWDVNFYEMLKNKYQDMYASIRKRAQAGRLDGTVSTVRGAFDVFVSRLINRSSPEEAEAFIRELQEAGAFSDRKYYARLRKKIHEVSGVAGGFDVDGHVRELDEAFRSLNG